MSLMDLSISLSDCSDSLIPIPEGLNTLKSSKEHGRAEKLNRAAAEVSCGPGVPQLREPFSGTLGNGLPSGGAVDQLASAITLQSLLTQFTHPQVRADFINHRFGWHLNPSLLGRLDELRWTLSPGWNAGTLERASAVNRRAAIHMTLLLGRDSSVLVLGDGGPETYLTYQMWYDTLSLIAADQYWGNNPPDGRCVHILSPEQLPITVKPHLGKTKAGVMTTTPGGLASSGGRNTDKKAKKNVKASNSAFDSSKIEELILSSSSDSGDTDTSSGGEEPKLHQTQRHYHRDHRDVVTPPVFQPDGGMHLREFFGFFEEYFAKKFNGTEHDQTQELAKFLTAELLEVYKVKGGRKLKYKDMKQELLEWYKRQRIGGKSYWRGQLEKARPSGEAIDIYGMKLVELARKAYPKDKRECAKRLRKHFLQTVAPEVAEKIQDAERVLRATPGKAARYMNFSRILELAVDLEKNAIRRKTVMWTLDTSGKQEPVPSVRAGRPWMTSSERPATKEAEPQLQTRIYSNSRLRTGKVCAACKRPGHSVDECWRAANACLICGQNHRLEECPRYDPNFRNRNRKPDNVKVGPARKNSLNF